MTTEAQPVNERLRAALKHCDKLTWRHAGLPVCACCDEIIKKYVRDHNHVTLKQRGYVCNRCNVLIGYAELVQQNPVEYRMIIEYLKKYDPTHPLL